MRTALEMIDRLEALARKLAATNLWTDCYDMRDEARAIVAELPDPDVVACREIVARWSSAKGLGWSADDLLRGDHDGTEAISLALDAYRAGRAAK